MRRLTLDQLLVALVTCSVFLFGCTFLYVRGEIMGVEAHIMSTLAVHERAMNNLVHAGWVVRTLTHFTVFVIGCVGGGIIYFFSPSHSAFSVAESASTHPLLAYPENIFLTTSMFLLGVMVALSVWALCSSIADTRLRQVT